MEIESLLNKIDSSLSWRKKELIQLMLDAKRAEGFQQTLAVRTAYLLTYAHFEGAIKGLATLYLEYVSSKKHVNIDLRDNFIGICVKMKCKKDLLESKQNHSQVELLEAIRQIYDSSELPTDGIIDTESNLKSSVLKNILETIGFNISKYELDFKFIDDVFLKTRNHIAHGERMDRYSNITDLENSHKKIMSLIEKFSDDVFVYANEMRYLR